MLTNLKKKKLPSTQQLNRHGNYCNLMPGDAIATEKGENKSNTVYFPAKHWDNKIICLKLTYMNQLEIQACKYTKYQHLQITRFTVLGKINSFFATLSSPVLLAVIFALDLI